MIKTKIKKAIAIASVATIAATSSLGGVLNDTFAAVIGTGSVNGTTSFDSSVNWNDTYTDNSATGVVTGIIVTAEVFPSLNMVISTGSIDLGILSSGVTSTGGLDLEVGTNAANGVNITARSGSGGLTNTSNGTIKIQDNQSGTFDDGIDDSYTFSSEATTATDSDYTLFANSGDLGTTEINNNTLEHTIYTTNAPEPDNAANADLEFIVGATTNAQTAAGNYQDTITFTVTGNF